MEVSNRARLVKKRVQYTIDQAILELAEYLMTKAGLIPATVIVMRHITCHF